MPWRMDDGRRGKSRCKEERDRRRRMLLDRLLTLVVCVCCCFKGDLRLPSPPPNGPSWLGPSLSPPKIQGCRRDPALGGGCRNLYQAATWMHGVYLIISVLVEQHREIHASGCLSCAAGYLQWRPARILYVVRLPAYLLPTWRDASSCPRCSTLHTCTYLASGVYMILTATAS